MNITASLVLYNNNPVEYGAAILSFLNGCNGIIYVFDNSTPPLQHELFLHSRVRYINNESNLGFGKAHNLTLPMIENVSDIHLFLNPDIYFEPNVLLVLASYLKNNIRVGAVMPRINYPNGSLQHLCKLLPTPIDLIIRRFIPFERFKAKLNNRYEMHWLVQVRSSYVPSLSGCFLVVRTELLTRLGGFDERYFMYMEDVDLVRRIGDVAETVYLPSVQVVHCYAKGSYFNHKLLWYHLRSAIRYFNKWGWLFDATRKMRNRSAVGKAFSNDSE